ncbi:TetR/AcrR family transcriptional regulator [Actinophytocola algeriensis]|uniref:AcrR family transcriptional regulator n=1 Tax=Actinophytocola algeriensis TaxID=1768010 RepID=A0A7W7VJF2_9PSEU|nr:TetR/AcrR family transcriptional regulator [Actinophytocola algeriensis]MBB4912284.1 AcrR family transcriptional regulator [Actinophytocola algeriensis]MBE1474200.1 AcrR family transcriptional regulator [Actinophytocola algeriensis]
MGHRENLLTAARECLLRNGYARTTVRDLVAASGANQASINYHFGSKDQLLTQAVYDLNEEWGRFLFEALEDTGEAREEAAQVARWQRIIESIQTNRELWFVNFETVAVLQHDDQIRMMNAAAQRTARTALANAFGGLGPDSDPADVHAVGAHYYSLLVGVALQWLTDPDQAPSADEIVRADHG